MTQHIIPLLQRHTLEDNEILKISKDIDEDVKPVGLGVHLHPGRPSSRY